MNAPDVAMLALLTIVAIAMRVLYVLGTRPERLDRAEQRAAELDLLADIEAAHAVAAARAEAIRCSRIEHELGVCLPCSDELCLRCTRGADPNRTVAGLMVDHRGDRERQQRELDHLDHLTKQLALARAITRG